MKRSKRIFLYIGILLAIIAAIGVSMNTVHSKSKTTEVLTINGMPVDNREFMLIFNQKRSQVYQYFKQKYGADDSAKFWTTSFQGEIPAEKAKGMVVDELKKIKVQQLWAKEKGLILDLTYESFLADLQKENKRREEAVAKGEVIYGVKQYTETTYYDYVFSNMQNKLQDWFGKDLTITDQDLTTFYEMIKDPLYKGKPTYKVQKIIIGFADEDGIFRDEKKREVALAKMNELRDLIGKGEDFTKLANEYSDAVKKGASIDTVIDEGFYKHGYEMYPETMEKVESLSAGQITDVYEEGTTLQIMKCIEKSESQFAPFEEKKDNVRVEYIKKKYQEKVDDLVKNATVTINNKAFNKLNIR